ncbi:deoxyribodipyrimidine photo-lyase [Chitiniphilus shinanonensis]|uniref:Deoxyribodipyrimidine photo-lyase n=1 Tax=Chitiniphilus shinanonensis TaxID=553088 RepID=A0ABQ6C0I0_9NEIS|nr:deoxyribodipyrimidine photo-lyase [Chitiniphilus shinanonensis]GLS05688.1 deoxyribodipyrimidine photo-lyase [Chitiniphilus shinanonensis]
MPDTALVWFRRDLRLFDHAALYHALKRHARVVAVFVFDRDLLDPLPADDRRVAFIHAALVELANALAQHGSALVVAHERAQAAIPRLARQYQAVAVHANHDDDPAARRRDEAVARTLADEGRRLFTHKDHVLFERDEIVTRQGGMYSVFTPYRRAWLARLDDFMLSSYPVARYLDRLAPLPPQPLPTLPGLGFAEITLALPGGMSGGEQLFEAFKERLDRYHLRRDFPALKGPSYLSAHLRFGTVSIRELARHAHGVGGPGAQAWLGELAWRDFYHQILWHRPDVVEHAFRPEYDALPFPNREDWFDAWREGRTGYPLVDAAMRQLRHSGYMHNRLRMVAASFLVKDLLVDWRWGERHFAALLLDYDLAANNGGWQWAASTGCDAQPYFRIFNPVAQSRKFDPDGHFIRRYCPELAALPDAAIHAPWEAPPLTLAEAGVRLGHDYPLPIVEHARQRELALALFKSARRP